MAAAFELGVYLWDKYDRQNRYDYALNLARQSGKPLLVVGGPHGTSSFFYQWFGNPAHGYGDVCLDTEASACRGAPRTVVASITNMPFGDKEFGVVYASHVLEMLPSLEEALKAVRELERVADKVVLSNQTKWWIGYWINSSLHQWITQDSSGRITVEAR